MAAQHEYFLASPAQLAGLDLAKGPVGQLPAEHAAELPGIDPAVVLLSLVAVLTAGSFDALRAEITDEVVVTGGPGEPWVVRVDDRVVRAIQGADGDPELEWDDVAAQWGAVVAEQVGDVEEDALLEITDELRRLCGAVTGERRLFCWSPAERG